MVAQKARADRPLLGVPYPHIMAEIMHRDLEAINYKYACPQLTDWNIISVSSCWCRFGLLILPPSHIYTMQ